MQKNILFTMLFILNYTSLYGQTYYFTTQIKSVKIENYSDNQFKVLSKTFGPYKFIFENPKRQGVKNLFTILKAEEKNGPEKNWYGHIEDNGYFEKNGKLLKSSLYFDTGNNESVSVLIAEDYSSITLFLNDGIILQYIQ